MEDSASHELCHKSTNKKLGLAKSNRVQREVSKNFKLGKTAAKRPRRSKEEEPANQPVTNHQIMVRPTKSTASCSLEAVLMREHGVRYGDAKRLVLTSRRALKMSRIVPWNEALQKECERRLRENPEQYPTIKTPAMVRAKSVKNVVVDKEEDFEDVTATDVPKEAPEKESPQSSAPSSVLERVESGRSVVADVTLEIEDTPALAEKEEEKERAASLVTTSEADTVAPAVVETEEEIKVETAEQGVVAVADTETKEVEASTATSSEEVASVPQPKAAVLDQWLDTILQTTSETAQEVAVVDAARKDEETMLTISKKEEPTDSTDGETEEETDSQRKDDGDELLEENSSSSKASDLAVRDEQQTTAPEFEDALDVSERTDHALDDSERTEYEMDTEYVLDGSERGTSLPLVEDSERTDTEDDNGAKTAAEWIADDCSQATDGSKCFTTAQELEENGINVAPGLFSQGEREFDDDVGAGEHNMDNCRKSADTVKRMDEPSIDNTTMVSVDTIPSIVYIKSGPPEVPDDEPLVQSFNLPISEREYYVPKKGVMRSIRRKFVRGMFRRRNSIVLSDNDTEVHMQTLVDL